VTEQAAVYMYLAELYPEARLSPAIGDPLRGPYLRWMVFYGSCFEPAVAELAATQSQATLSGQAR
jgi:glutathione S-transferase